MSPAPFLLAIETAGSACSAAVARGEESIASEHRALRYGHAEALLPMVARVMREAAASASELDIVATAAGPGGFTGIRVGLAAAHGIALAARARLVAVDSFAAVAALVRIAETKHAALLVALDSRRADLYVQPFAAKTALPLAPPQAVLPEALADYAAAFIGEKAGPYPLLIAGDAAEAAAVALAGFAAVEIAENSAPDALGVAAAALRLWRSGEAVGPARPLYLRPPDVTVSRRAATDSPAVSAEITQLPAGVAQPLSVMHSAAFPEDPWDSDAMARVLALSGVFGYLAWQQGDPVGFVVARDLGEEIEVVTLGVLPAARRQALGRRLLSMVVADAGRREIGSIVLEVAADNDAARALYANSGFVQVGQRPRYYRRTSGLMHGLILRRAVSRES